MTRLLTVAFLFSLGVLWGCDVLLETDLSEESVILLAPGEELETERLTLTFWWEPVAGATEYQLQVVSPAWDQIELLHLDSLTTGNQISYTLDPGQYAWAVRALNSAYSSPWSEGTFTIDTTSDLSIQVFELQTPDNGARLNSETVTFTWDDLSIAEQYEFQLLSNPSFDTLLTTNQLAYSFPLEDGDYTWRVVALNSSSENRSTSRNFTLDFTAPVAPTLVSPADSAQSNESAITLIWSSTDTDLAAYEVFLYEPDGSTLVDGFPVTTEEENYVITNADALADTTYSWTVLATDIAGNVGPTAGPRVIERIP
ncbi:MAG TPA: hypothetical protein DCE41_02960 [Cytophagales bacterium]|nr:hypothetical protein [Cytophagales bacterium]HAA19045.1 hypothetical protein [Cytophagales bacterium]